LEVSQFVKTGMHVSIWLLGYSQNVCLNKSFKSGTDNFRLHISLGTYTYMQKVNVKCPVWQSAYNGFPMPQSPQESQSVPLPRQGQQWTKRGEQTLVCFKRCSFSVRLHQSAKYCSIFV